MAERYSKVRMYAKDPILFGRGAAHSSAPNAFLGAQAASVPQSAAAPTAIQDYRMTERSRFAASCRELQASSLRSPAIAVVAAASFSPPRV
jgi:hypothetical protein